MMSTDRLVQQAEFLLDQNRPAEALAVIQSVTAVSGAPSAAFTYHANALQALGRADEALPLARQAVTIAPASVSARHNLAALQGDLGLCAEAEAAARQALDLGGDAPETWLVLGRALQGQNRFDEAEAAFRAAAARRPGDVDALRDLAHLIWMRTADLDAATVELDAAIARTPAHEALRAAKARLQEYAGAAQAGYATLATGLLSPAGHLAAARLALQFDPAKAMHHVRQAGAQGRHAAHPVRLAMAECHIALGEPGEALEQISHLREATPLDQHVLALQATAMRMLDEPGYRALYDYQAFVRPAVIDTPEGWPDLAAYLADLQTALVELHGLKTHPVGQSLRGGSQTSSSLRTSDHPAIQAFFQAIDGPIRRYLAALGPGEDPLRSRNTGDYRIAGCWSVRLQPNGFHADHVHPQGWLSSAFYIQLPATLDDGDRQGWIKFGEPPLRTPAGLPAEHAVRPEPGTLVLFPSYMWHGTVPFSGEDTRLTIAFDVVPA